MNRLCRWLAPMLACAFLLGCATPTPKVNIAPGALAPGETIVLVQPPPVVAFSLYAPHPGMAFGAIGGLIAGSHMASRAEEVRKMVVEQHKFRPEAALVEALRAELQAAGFRVEVQPGDWTVVNGHHVPDPTKLNPAARHVLYAVPRMVGFWTEGITGNYLPTVQVRAALYGPNRSRLAYDGYHITGGIKPTGDGWIIVPHVPTNFSTYESLLAKPAVTADSLKQAIGVVAQSIVRDLTGRLPAAVRTPPTQPAGPVPVQRPVAAAPTPAPAPVPVPATRPAPASPAAAAPMPAPPVVAPVPPSAAPGEPKAPTAALDGHWSGSFRCGPYQGPGTVDTPGPWTAPVSMTVLRGYVTMVRTDGSTYRESLGGALNPDMTVTLDGTGAMFATPQRPWITQVVGRFSAAPLRFEGRGMLKSADGTALRTCRLELSQPS